MNDGAINKGRESDGSTERTTVLVRCSRCYGGCEACDHTTILHCACGESSALSAGELRQDEEHGEVWVCESCVEAEGPGLAKCDGALVAEGGGGLMRCTFGDCAHEATHESRRYAAGFTAVVEARPACEEHAKWLARIGPRVTFVRRAVTILPPAPPEPVEPPVVPPMPIVSGAEGQNGIPSVPALPYALRRAS